MLSLVSIYSRERRFLMLAIFFVSALASLAIAFTLAFVELGGGITSQLSEVLGAGRYIILKGEMDRPFTDADLAAALASVCSAEGYGVAYRPVYIQYLNGTRRAVTAAFVPTGAVEGVRFLEVVASGALASTGDSFYLDVGGRRYLVSVARVRPVGVYVPGLSADLYVDGALLGGARQYDVLVVGKGPCGGADVLKALFPKSEVLDADYVLGAFWGQLFLYLAAAGVVALSSAAAAASLTFTLASAFVASSFRDFAVMRVLGLKRRGLLALALAVLLTPSLGGVAVAALASASVYMAGVELGPKMATSAAFVVLLTALSLLPSLVRLYRLRPVEALRYE
ncbi:MAG: hypothetical protein ABWK05_03010 [Pyrobaculum sp.]